MLNGMTIAKARKACFSVMHAANTNSLYSDIGWQGPHDVMKAMTDAGIDWVLKEARYFNDDKSKIWNLAVKFIDSKGKERILNADITTFCAGTCADPWSRYDMTTCVF